MEVPRGGSWGTLGDSGVLWRDLRAPWGFGGCSEWIWGPLGDFGVLWVDFGVSGVIWGLRGGVASLGGFWGPPVVVLG